jgi:glutamyl-tRNA synthetase
MVRTRFAPSPTGFIHIGSLRTALYNYIFARKNKGTFILRIEDTDQARYVEGALESLLKTLSWVGLEYDEGPGKEGKFGPYIQSQRTELYRKYAQELLDKAAAYHCFCTPERLAQMRERQTQLKLAPMYDRTCLQISQNEIESKIKEGVPFVIRQKIPHGRKLKFKDLIRGNVLFDTVTIDDQVLMKSDNFPTYHLANVIDDHLMEITHVIRGEEWLPSTPKHILLYEAFGWQNPEFAHIPLLLNKDKTKLSKRQGDVGVEDYVNKGYSREAIINFIALLGWHPGSGENNEIFSLQDLVEKFSLEKVHKSGAIFDIEKLNWFNFLWQKKIHHENLKRLAQEIDPQVQFSVDRKNETVYSFSSPQKEHDFTQQRAEKLLALCKDHIPAEWLKAREMVLKALITVEEKILRTPAEIKTYIEFYFSLKDFPAELLLNEKMNVDKNIATKAVLESIKSLQQLENFGTIAAIQENLIKLIAELGLKNGQVLWPLRVALSGEQFSPGVFELIWVLGKSETLARLGNTGQSLKALYN